MRIQFTIKESLSEIIDQLSNSDFWSSEIVSTPDKKIIKIKDLAYNLEATAEVHPHDIVLHTAWSNFTYRVFQSGPKVVCEYDGAFRGLLEQNLLPHITPVGNILDYPVLESSLYKNGEKKTLREYARDNAMQRQLRKQKEKAKLQASTRSAQIVSLYPRCVAKFVKEDAPSCY